MSKLNIKIPFEVARDFYFRGAQYKVGEIFDFYPNKIVYRHLFRKNLFKEVSDKIQYICGKRELHIADKKYLPGETILEETIPDIERFIKYGYIIKKLIEDPKETLTEVTSDVIENIIEDIVEKEEQEISIKKYTDLAKKYELKFNQIKLLLENEFKIKVSSNGNIPEDKIALYEEFIKNQEIKQPEIIGE